MSELDARYERGQQTRQMFGGGTINNAGSMSRQRGNSHPTWNAFSEKHFSARSGTATPSAHYNVR